MRKKIKYEVKGPFTNIWGEPEIGEGTEIGAYTEIGDGVRIGKHCKIEAKVFIPPGVTIGSKVFIGPGVIFTNDKYPSADGKWKMSATYVSDNAAIGAGAVILPDIVIGEGALIGAGSVVTKDVPAEAIVVGNPAALHRMPIDSS